jgi:rhodanese-related sulfurtransferase
MEPDRQPHIEITPSEVKALQTRGEKFAFVDVREQWEYDAAHIDGSTLIPLREVPANLPRLQAAGEIVFLCHHGMRSLDAAAWLRSQGVEGARSMSGGIDRWSLEIDPGVPRY